MEKSHVGKCFHYVLKFPSDKQAIYLLTDFLTAKTCFKYFIEGFVRDLVVI